MTLLATMMLLIFEEGLDEDEVQGVDLYEAALGVDHHGFKDGLLGGEGGSNIASAPILQHQDYDHCMLTFQLSPDYYQ